MGIHSNTLDFMWESLSAAGIHKLKNKNMMELGNQIMRQDAKDKYNFRSGHSRVYFLNLRCNHHAIDWNGEHGAVPIDMCQPIEDQVNRYVDMFDVLTDFGCMEHYKGKSKDHSDHWQSWKNVHDMGRVGCVYIHTLPHIDSVPRHGSFHYDTEFFDKLCEANGYQIITNKRYRCDERTDTRDYVFCAYTKTTKTRFGPSPEIFEGWLHR